MRRKIKMPRFRPDTKSNGMGSFGGFMEGNIVDFNDRSDEFAWADVFVDVTFQVPTSQYPVVYALKGTYEKEDNGNIKSCSLLNRIYYLFDAVGFKGAPNVTGEWEDEDGVKIDKLDSYLNINHVPKDALESENYPYGIFVWKQWVEKDGKAYTRVCPKIVMNTTKGMADLKSYVAFLKQKNLIKEHTGETPSGDESPQTPSTLNF